MSSNCLKVIAIYIFFLSYSLIAYSCRCAPNLPAGGNKPIKVTPPSIPISAPTITLNCDKTLIKNTEHTFDLQFSHTGGQAIPLSSVTLRMQLVEKRATGSTITYTNTMNIPTTVKGIDTALSAFFTQPAMHSTSPPLSITFTLQPAAGVVEINCNTTLFLAGKVISTLQITWQAFNADLITQRIINAVGVSKGYNADLLRDILQKLKDAQPVTNEEKNQALMEAVKKGDHRIFEALFKLPDLDFTITTYGENSLLRYAVDSGNPAIVDALLKAAPTLINQPNELETIPIHHLISEDLSSIEEINQRKEVAALLLAQNADISKKDYLNATPLHKLAAHKKVAAIAQLLLEKGGQAFINEQDNLKQTPLFLAVSNGDLAMLKLLIDHGADVNTPDYDGIAPLELAITNNNPDQVKMLLEANATVPPAIHTLAENIANLNPTILEYLRSIPQH